MTPIARVATMRAPPRSPFLRIERFLAIGVSFCEVTSSALAHELGHAIGDPQGTGRSLDHYDLWTPDQRAAFSMWGTVMFNW